MPLDTSTRSIEIECQRYDPETDSKPRLQTYKVPFSSDMSVLQGLRHIKDHIDGSLTFRWSCRMAICGSCGMMINGIPHLACETFLRDFYPNKVRIGPLQHFPIVRDMVIDQNDFLDKLEKIKPYIVPREEKPVSAGPYMQTPKQMEKYLQYSECINCLLCYAACPQYGITHTFLGPAATALLHRYNEDSRDKGWDQRRDVVNAEDGVWPCTLVGYCSEVCPKNVDPAHAVNQNKVNSAMDYFGILKLLMPKGA